MCVVVQVHAGEDDLGRGNFADSNTTGHAGARMGCCVITIKPTHDNPSHAASLVFSTLIVLASCLLSTLV